MQDQLQIGIDLPPSATVSADNGYTCVVCLAAPKDSVVLPCKHLAMCAECTKAVFTSISQPRCPVCRLRIEDCIYGMFF